MLKMKNEMPFLLGFQSWSFFNGKTPFPGAKAILIDVYMLVCAFLKHWRNVSLTSLMFFVLTRYKTVLKTLLLWSIF